MSPESESAAHEPMTEASEHSRHSTKCCDLKQGVDTTSECLSTTMAFGDRICQLVREKLLHEYASNTELYEEADLKLFVLSGNGYILRYLDRRDYEVDATVEMMRDTLRWRKRIEVASFDSLSFPREFYEIGALFPYEKDIEGNVMLIMRARVYKNIPELKEGLEKFTVYRMFEAHALGARDDNLDRGWTFLFDLTNISFAQYDIPELIWLINTLLKYYPAGLKRVLVYNIPRLFRPIISLILTIVPKEWKHLMTFANGDALYRYVAKDALPDFLGGNCERGYRVVPEGARPVEEMAAERYGMSREQVAKIRAHFAQFFEE